MLDLRFLWDDSSPCLVACSGGLRYVLLQASVIHHLPVVAHSDMHVLLEAIQVFTENGQLWDARQWAKKLGRKLSLFHVGSPTTTLPEDHADFTSDPQVNFSSPDAMPLAFSNNMPLASSTTTTVQIEEVAEDEKLDDKSMQDTEGRRTTNIQRRLSSSSLCLFPLALATTFKTLLSKMLCSILLTTVLHHLPLKSQRVRAQQTLTASPSLRLCPQYCSRLSQKISSSTAPSSSGQLATDSSSCLSPELPQAFFAIVQR